LLIWAWGNKEEAVDNDSDVEIIENPNQIKPVGYSVSSLLLSPLNVPTEKQNARMLEYQAVIVCYCM
jgi:hypothetical protein